MEKPFSHPVPRAPKLEHVLLFVFLAVMLAALAGLFFLKRGHDRQARVSATASVLNKGIALLNTFCSLDEPELAALTPERWRELSRAADAVFSVRPDLQSLAVARDGVTVFQRQAQGLDARQKKPAHPLADASNTTLSLGTVEIAGRPQPVFIISRTLKTAAGQTLTVEATLKREAVGEAEGSARRLVSSLFFFSIAVLIISFATCALVLILALVRDRHREERARREEHLAFSGVLANGILHDFRNPMSAVRLDAQMLGREMARPEGFRAERVTELSGRIARTMARMDKIFQEFLFLAKPANEKPEPMDVGAAVSECLDTLAPRLDQAGIQAKFAPPPAPVYAEAYSMAFRRALLNVLVNATQFAPRGSAIDVKLAAAPGNVTLDVIDAGPGIPPKMREKVFEMFVTGRPEGTGLGLFLARTAILRCGGTLAVVPTASGTDMRFTLPTAGAARETRK